MPELFWGVAGEGDGEFEDDEMNIGTISAECAHRMHGHCDYEDCACACHLSELIHEEFDSQDLDEEEMLP